MKEFKRLFNRFKQYFELYERGGGKQNCKVSKYFCKEIFLKQNFFPSKLKMENFVGRGRTTAFRV